jgi:transcriptional regulator with XRE-family HTH domain
MNISESLKYQRDINNLSQNALAKATGISQQKISYYESGKHSPPIEDCLKIATFYGVTLEELLDVEGLLSETEKAEGATQTIKKSITPIEDDMLYLFNEVGKKYGESGQQSLIAIAQNMLNLK